MPVNNYIMNASRVEYMKCPKCGEVLPLERDKHNMSILPTCPCGHGAKLGDLLGQMQQVVDEVIPPRFTGGYGLNGARVSDGSGRNGDASVNDVAATFGDDGSKKRSEPAAACNLPIAKAGGGQ